MHSKIYPVAKTTHAQSHADKAEYERLYNWSISDPDGFWTEQGKRLDWIKPYTCTSNFSFSAQDTYIKWFEDGQLNAAYNCIDRHLKHDAQRTAIIWEADEPGTDKHISYQTLHDEV